MAHAQRVFTTLERPLLMQVKHMAARDGMTVAAKVRDLVRDAAERDEDADLEALVVERKAKGGKFLSHAEFWREVK